MNLRPTTILLSLLLGLAAQGVPTRGEASELRIAATVAPVHSLVAMVADGIAEPSLIVRPGASPHGYAMKPSEVSALNEADVVFWVGESLEPWMTKAIGTLADDAVVIELGEVDGIEHLPFREGGVWGGDDHDEHGHDHDHHDHGDMDPHVWLAPDHGLVWLSAIADTLAAADPPHAADYRKNADHAADGIKALASEIDQLLQPVKQERYVVFHDAYQYFEHQFGMNPLGSVSFGDADRPGPARLMEVRDALAGSGAACIFAEPQFEPKLIETVIEGTDVKKGILDPIGAGLEPGAMLYQLLLRGLAQDLLDCLG